MDVEEIQSRLEDLVKAEPLLKDRPVLIEDKGNLVAELETALSTQSLAVVIALSGGQAKDGSTLKRTISAETFEIVIHRGLLDGPDVPSTLRVMMALRKRLHGAGLHESEPNHGAFSYSRHDMREGGDGTYARVLNVTCQLTLTSTP